MVVLTVSLLVLAACSRTPPEQALRTRLTDLQAAIEARDVARMQRFLAEDFIGNDGMDHRQVRALATTTMLRYRGLALGFGPLEIEFRSPTGAMVSFTAMAGGGDGGLLPRELRAWRVQSTWRLENGEWMLVQARWVPQL